MLSLYRVTLQLFGLCYIYDSKNSLLDFNVYCKEIALGRRCLVTMMHIDDNGYSYITNGNIKYTLVEVSKKLDSHYEYPSDIEYSVAIPDGRKEILFSDFFQ